MVERYGVSKFLVTIKETKEEYELANNIKELAEIIKKHFDKEKRKEIGVNK